MRISQFLLPLTALLATATAVRLFLSRPLIYYTPLFMATAATIFLFHSHLFPLPLSPSLPSPYLTSPYLTFPLFIRLLYTKTNPHHSHQAPYNLEQDADLIKRLEEAGARARADPNLEARFASAFYPRETSTPLKAVRSSSSSSSSDDTEIEDDLSTLPPLPYPGFNPYNLTLPDPSLYPLPPQNPHGPRNPNTPTPVLDSRNPSPVAEDYNGATPDRDQAKYNGPYTYRTHYCGKPRIPADLAKVQDGEHYLYTLKGKPKIQGTKKKGQGWCVRVSCIGEAAIFVCNDVNFLSLLPFFFVLKGD